MPDQINGSGPKLVNSELFQPIPVDQFNAGRHEELLQSTKQMPDGRLVVQPGVREKVGGLEPDDNAVFFAKDRNNNGVVDPDDTVVTVDGRTLNRDEVGAYLQRLCQSRAPNKTVFTESSQAAEIRKSNGALIESGPGIPREMLHNRNGGRVSSAGAYDEGLKGCNYNRDGIHLEAGRTATEVKGSYEDASGSGAAYLDLKTGNLEPAPVTQPTTTR